MHRRRRAVVVAASAVAVLGATGCGSLRTAAPRCDDSRRVAIVAQSLPSASYVPCLDVLRPGWSARDFDSRSGRTRFVLASDRDGGHPVTVQLQRACDVGAATSTTPRADGARTYLRLRSISPRYAGTMLDVFPGGCVTYRFDFARGPHIGLIDDLEHEVRLLARAELARDLRAEYGIDLDR
jgi:hypothetical protein